VNVCVDLSATPFYLNRSGAEPGRPFPWIVSDFGLIDAIESGLVKIPQLPVQDTTGAEIPAYFNVWKWIVEKKLTAGEKGGKRGQVKPEAVLKWAQQPIAQLAGLWSETFQQWASDTVAGRRPPLPPVFIVVCRDTRLARSSMNGSPAPGTGPRHRSKKWRHRGGKEYTVRIDSRVVEDLSQGVAKTDESRRLRFVLETVGKLEWPGGNPPDEYAELVDRLNRKADEVGGVKIEAAVPPGRDVRCIVSVAMLTEGWDATTVTHIVGLRPFESQLLLRAGRGARPAAVSIPRPHGRGGRQGLRRALRADPAEGDARHGHAAAEGLACARAVTRARCLRDPLPACRRLHASDHIGNLRRVGPRARNPPRPDADSGRSEGEGLVDGAGRSPFAPGPWRNG